MLSLVAQKRDITGRQVRTLRQQGLVPAVLYGPGIKNLNLAVSSKDFEKIYKVARESTLFELKVDKKTFKVLIHDIQRDALKGDILHIDFYQPSLTREIQANVNLVFEGTAPAVKELGGTLVKNISEIEVRALPEHLPHEIKVDLSKLRTFEDYIAVKDLLIGEKVTIVRDPEDVVAQVLPPAKVEEELEKPIEEKVEEIETVEKKARKIEEAPTAEDQK